MKVPSGTSGRSSAMYFFPPDGCGPRPALRYSSPWQALCNDATNVSVSPSRCAATPMLCVQLWSETARQASV